MYKIYFIIKSILYTISYLFISAGERSAFSLPFNFIHFALSADSQVYRQLQQGHPVALLYIDANT